MKNNIIITILSVLYLLHMVPALGYRYPSILYAVLVISLFLLLTYKVGFKGIVTIIPIFFIPILDIFIKTSGYSIYIVFQQLSGVIQSLILPLLCIYIIKFRKNKLGKLLFFTYFVIILITCITSYIGYKIFPDASRELAFYDRIESDLLYAYLNANIGGFSFIYSITILSVLLIYTTKNYTLRKGIVGIISVTSLLITGLVIYKSQYTTAIIIYILSLILLLVNHKFGIKHMVILTIFGLLFVGVFNNSISVGLMKISEMVESASVSQRFYDLSQYIIGGHTSINSDLDARSYLYMKSINTFINKPLGSWNNNDNGGHSFIFDSAARYGIWGIILLMIMIIKLYKLYIRPLKNNTIYGYALIMYIIFMILAILNPHIFTDVLMFVLPLYHFLYSHNNIHIDNYKRNMIYNVN